MAFFDELTKKAQLVADESENGIARFSAALFV